MLKKWQSGPPTCCTRAPTYNNTVEYLPWQQSRTTAQSELCFCKKSKRYRVKIAQKGASQRAKCMAPLAPSKLGHAVSHTSPSSSTSDPEDHPCQALESAPPFLTSNDHRPILCSRLAGAADRSMLPQSRFESRTRCGSHVRLRLLLYWLGHPTPVLPV